MDFAPYQDTAPETVRALSPPPYNRPSLDRGASGLHSPSPLSPAFKPSAIAPLSRPRPGYTDIESGRGRLDEFATSLPIRLDYEACLAYLLLPPAGGALLLIFEHKSDYVRYVSFLVVFFFLLNWWDVGLWLWVISGEIG